LVHLQEQQWQPGHRSQADNRSAERAIGNRAKPGKTPRFLLSKICTKLKGFLLRRFEEVRAHVITDRPLNGPEVQNKGMALFLFGPNCKLIERARQKNSP
jgi:hypothetical protein